MKKKSVINKSLTFFLPIILTLANVCIGFSAWVYPQIKEEITTGNVNVSVGALDDGGGPLITCTSSRCEAGFGGVNGHLFEHCDVFNGKNYYYFNKEADFDEFCLTYNFNLNNIRYKKVINKDQYSVNNIVFNYSLDVIGLKNDVTQYFGTNNSFMNLNNEGWDKGKLPSLIDYTSDYNRQILQSGDIAIGNHNVEQSYSPFTLKCYFLKSILQNTNGGQLDFVFKLNIRGTNLG